MVGAWPSSEIEIVGLQCNGVCKQGDLVDRTVKGKDGKLKSVSADSILEKFNSARDNYSLFRTYALDHK